MFQPPQHATTLRGFTLLELVISLVVTGILMSTLASAMLLATQAMPDDERPAEATMAAGEIASQMAGEIYYAQSFAERTANAVTFTVADRNDEDDKPETIRYAWSGTPGDPMTRQYNGGDTVTVLENVQELDLAYETEEVVEEIPAPPTESSEMQLANYTDLNKLAGLPVTTSNWIGQCFQPSLPADALGWRITRVRFQAKATGGPKGITMVQTRPADVNGLPSTRVLEEIPMYESGLTKSYSWQDFSFSTVSWFAPGDEVCLVLRQIGKGARSANISYDSAGGSGRVTTTNGGASWSRDAGKSLLYYAYGTTTTVTPPIIERRYLQVGVDITLRVGSDAPVQVDASTRVLNRPEVDTP